MAIGLHDIHPEEAGSLILPGLQGLRAANLRIPPEAVIPRVDTDVFDENNAQFWLGVIATPDQTLMANECLAARILRANVYIDECRFLPPDARDNDGGESDLDDSRATQYAAIENREQYKRLVGTIRAIHKRDPNDTLPVEIMFPEVFADQPAATGSVEASRFIARHKNRHIQRLVSLGLMRAVTARAHVEGSDAIYAVIESPLAQLFERIGMPFTQISELKKIGEYGNTKNMAARFDPKEIYTAVEHDKTTIVSAFFQNALVSLGVGHYDDTLLRGPQE